MVDGIGGGKSVGDPCRVLLIYVKFLLMAMAMAMAMAM